MAYAGEAEAPDGKAFVIKVKGENSFEAKLFIDQTTSYPLMLSYRAPAPQVMMMRAQAPSGGHGTGHGDIEDATKEAKDQAASCPKQADFQLSFADYRMVDGVRFPHHITKAIDGQVSEEIEVVKYKINPPLKPESFKK